MKSVAEIRAEKKAQQGASEATGAAEGEGTPREGVAQERRTGPQRAPERADSEQSAAEGQEPTEEEQEMYTKLVLAGTKALTDKKSNPAVMKMLEDMADTPAAAIGHVAATVMIQLDEKANGQIPEDMILPPLAEIIEQTGTLAHEAGIFQVDEAMLQQAAGYALMELAEAYGVEDEEIAEFLEQVPPEDAQSMVAEYEQILAGGGQPAQAQPAAQPGAGAPGAGGAPPPQQPAAPAGGVGV